MSRKENESTQSQNIRALQAYEVLAESDLKDLSSHTYFLRHKKTGARIALLSNEDDNKVFSIGFKTPAMDSTGVAHILEHSVLCGSKEFPIKDPFIELVKGSLNTFLNAMTYPDKTVYPVASCNDKDFQNLMHVYLDAVFYPNIYENPAIFAQEGWHYELDTPEGELGINGVVYSEMKGAFSSPDDVLERQIMNQLYPSIAYGYESGGDPEEIPSLTYENFLQFHRKYYHPSNSYIYLYGDMDMAEKLLFLDEHYLNDFDELAVDSEIGIQVPFKEPKRVVKEYPIGDGEKEEESGYLSVSYSIADSLDREKYLAFQILDYAICAAPGTALKKALTEAGIGQEIDSHYENGIQQPYFTIIAKNADLQKEAQFLSIIDQELRKMIDEGIDRKALMAGINYYEFRYREAEFGPYPKGLMYGLQMLDSWLYDDARPFLHLEQMEIFATLRQKADQGYFESLLQEYLLNNPHKAVVILKPMKGLGAKMEKELMERLASIKEAMSEQDLQKIQEDAKVLKAFQEKEETQEDMEKIPVLSRADLRKDAVKTINEEYDFAGVKLLLHEVDTNGIAYVKLIFRMDHVSAELFPYVGLLKGCLGMVDTAQYGYGDLFSEVYTVTGGITPAISVYSDVKDPDTCTCVFMIVAKVLYQNLAQALNLIQEMILTGKYQDTKRLYEIVAEGKSHCQSQMISAGHMIASSRALSYGSKEAALNGVLSGLPFYRLICDIEQNFETCKEDIAQKMFALSKEIFCAKNLMIDFTGEGTVIRNAEADFKRLCDQLYEGSHEGTSFVPQLVD
ncbi:MAG: insulinase family protein, partial [Lachnospiraceae bacterium]|nr:insulinase family protein [Lachnospiraceae bacterium]